MNEKARGGGKVGGRVAARKSRLSTLLLVVSRHFGGLIPCRQTNKLGLNAAGSSSLCIEKSMQIN